MEESRGIVFGCFDLLHAGHIMLLEEASRYCASLTVALHTDPSIDRPDKNTPVQTYFERLIQVSAVSFVDDVVGYSHESDIIPILSYYGHDIRFLGDDYATKEFTGKQYCEDNGITIMFLSRAHNYSTAELRRRIRNAK